MDISTQHAIVKTMGVEIKAMQINNKQVTQSVFRQMDKKPLLDYNYRKLNGVVWGRVNYCPDKCQDDAEHIHEANRTFATPRPR